MSENIVDKFEAAVAQGLQDVVDFSEIGPEALAFGNELTQLIVKYARNARRGDVAVLVSLMSSYELHARLTASVNRFFQEEALGEATAEDVDATVN